MLVTFLPTKAKFDQNTQSRQLNIKTQNSSSQKRSGGSQIRTGDGRLKIPGKVCKYLIDGSKCDYCKSLNKSPVRKRPLFEKALRLKKKP